VTILERLGTRVARATLPDRERQAARLHVVDALGAWVAGSATAEGRALLEFGSAGGADLPTRVAAHCALARLSEIDDIHRVSATTPGALVVPAALTIAATRGGPLAEAVAAGYEAMTRLGTALNGPSMLSRGIWPTYLSAPFAVAALVSRLLGLEEKQAARALAIALGFSSPAVGRQSGPSGSRWLAIGNAARNGMAAALAAQAGFSGDPGIFEGDFFPSVYGLSPDPAALLEERAALSDTSFKPWCAAKQTMAAAQALREIIDGGVPPSSMSHLAVGVPPLTLKMVDHDIVAGERTSHLTSVSYQMALIALHPDATIDVRQTPESVSEEIRDFMAKISVSADADLQQHYPKSWPARVVVTVGGARHEKLVLHVPGDPERPFDESQVAAKFWRLVAPLVGDHAAEELLRLGYAALDGGDTKALLEALERCAAALQPEKA
jgi:2-methylcitrate dehydratase PrpD